MDLMRTHSFLGGTNQEGSQEPFVKGDMASLKDCPNSNTKLLSAFSALPNTPSYRLVGVLLCMKLIVIALMPTVGAKLHLRAILVFRGTFWLRLHH